MRVTAEKSLQEVSVQSRGGLHPQSARVARTARGHVGKSRSPVPQNCTLSPKSGLFEKIATVIKKALTERPSVHGSFKRRNMSGGSIRDAAGTC